MKNLLLKLNKKDTFFVLLAPISFISVLFLNRIIENIITNNNIMEFTPALYFSRLVFLILSILITLYTLKILRIFNKIYLNAKKSYYLTFAFSALFILYICSFIHPLNMGIFFIEVFIPSLSINIVITYIINLLITHKVSQYH